MGGTLGIWSEKVKSLDYERPLSNAISFVSLRIVISVHVVQILQGAAYNWILKQTIYKLKQTVYLRSHGISIFPKL